MSIDLESLRSELASRSQLMRSAEADFEKNTWTFMAPSFTVSGGDHLIISLADWDKFWREKS